MFDMFSRKVIESLRSGIPSFAVGAYFSESRPTIIKEINNRLDDINNEDKSSGMIIVGKYGEGKTHLLNTVRYFAEERNMVVSYISLSKETPMDKLYVIYQKIIANTYLPGHLQPGFMDKLANLTINTPLAKDLLLYSKTQLETDKLYYLLSCLFKSDSDEDKYALQGDLEGDFIPNTFIKNTYRKIYSEPVKFNIPFVKSKHTYDYFCLISHLFKQLNYNGWVILIDETELIGRLGKKARLNSYKNMFKFLFPSKKLENIFSLFGLSASYEEDVIEAKNEYDNMVEVYPDDYMDIKATLDLISKSYKLHPLNKEEIHDVFVRLIALYEKAYEWKSPIDVDNLLKHTRNTGFLLRTRIRAAIEYLDGLYQYNEASVSEANSLDKEDYHEEIVLDNEE